MVTKKSFSFWIRESGKRGFYGKLAKNLNNFKAKKLESILNFLFEAKIFNSQKKEEKMYNFNKKTNEMSFTVLGLRWGLLKSVKPIVNF